MSPPVFTRSTRPATASTPTPPEGSRPYTAHGAARQLWAHRGGEIVLSGPAGTGKSRACLEKLHFCAMKYARMRGLVIRKTRESLSEAALVTFEEKVLPAGSSIAEGPRRNYRQVYHYPNGSEIVVGGLDKPGKIMSTEYDMIYVQEATELDLADWLALTTRLRNGVMPYQQVIADCNPDAPTHWLWLRGQRGVLSLLHSRHEDNPTLWRAGEWTEAGLVYLARLDQLGVLNPETGEREGAEYQRLRHGQWVQATGQIYRGVWSDGPADGNVTEAADYEPGAGPVVWAVDDGYVGAIDPTTGTYTGDSHPRVILYWQERLDGRLCLFDEYYAIELQDDAQLAAGLARPYPAPEYAVVDKSAASLKGRMHMLGIYTKNGAPSVDESVKTMRHAIGADANGYRRVLVHPRCRHFRSEMLSYRRDANGAIVKQFDHGPDAARYYLWTKRYEG